MPIACLPWYDLAEVRSSHDRLWSHVASQLRQHGLLDIPDTLDRRTDYESQWQEPGLLLGQACGYDVYCSNDYSLQIVGVPVYGWFGCEGAGYRSFVIVRDDSRFESLSDLQGAHCVINSPRSHSGMNVLQALVAPLARAERFFASVQISGAHERSLAMVAEGTAEIAAIDCITYGLLQHHRPDALAATRVIHETAVIAAPPYVTGADTDASLLPVLRAAIDKAITALHPRDRGALGLKGVAAAKLADYQAIGEFRHRAQVAGYRELSTQLAKP